MPYFMMDDKGRIIALIKEVQNGSLIVRPELIADRLISNGLRFSAENVLVHIKRAGVWIIVPFSDLKAGDIVTNCKNGQTSIFTCASDAHRSGDASYDGWLVFSTDGHDYYPEDF